MLLFYNLHIFDITIFFSTSILPNFCVGSLLNQEWTSNQKAKRQHVFTWEDAVCLCVHVSSGDKGRMFDTDRL